MRALVALALLIPVAAMAGPLDRRVLRLPSDMPPARPASDAKITLQPYRPLSTQPITTMNLGPFEAEIGGGRHFARYHLNGASVLGGSVNGSFDGRGAKIQLTWSDE